MLTRILERRCEDVKTRRGSRQPGSRADDEEEGVEEEKGGEVRALKGNESEGIHADTQTQRRSVDCAHVIA